MLEDGSIALCIGKVTSMKDVTDGDLLFQVSIYHGKATNGTLILKDENSTETGPCTNHPDRSSICNLVYWSYKP